MTELQKFLRFVSLLALLGSMVFPLHVTTKEGSSAGGVAELRDNYVGNAETDIDREKIHRDGTGDSTGHQRPGFPTTITSVNCPIIINESVPIDGQHFGTRQGTVICCIRRSGIFV
jgi:hypothetical protein